MAPLTSKPALELIINHLKDRPSRIWSLIITLYGDGIVPRGGSVWLGTLLEFFKALDVDDGAVRTAMSRLAADGWIERTRLGRNSFYRLADKGLNTFRAATEHIYYAKAREWTGCFDLVLRDDGQDNDTTREALRGELAGLGFGMALPGLWLMPEDKKKRDIASPVLRLSAKADVETGRKLAAQAWPLGEIGDAYRRFTELFVPLDAALAPKSSIDLTPIDALVARILLIHEYRRIILRDPILPVMLLPEDWLGVAARELCARLYHKLLPVAELWLDQYMLTETGAAPKPGPDFYERFRA